jgi:L-aminopeptidase/D-esterase-like protein
LNTVNFFKLGNIKLGHAQNFEAATGCTVLLCEEGAVCGVDVRGGAPGTRETDLLNPVNLVEKVHAIVLSGGSAFGLDAAGGAVKYLEEKGTGFDVGVTHVPIVPAAVLFDLTIGDHHIRPDSTMGYEACVNATNIESRQGNIGAGTGCTIGKIAGPDRATKGGFGISAFQQNDLIVGAIVAVNCLGDVIDPETKEKLAGLLNEEKSVILDSEEFMLNQLCDESDVFSGNTTIGAVVTNANLTKAQATKLASMTHDAFARTMRPSHTMFDGDTIFALSIGERAADLSTVGIMANRAMERAIISAVKNAETLHGVKCFKDLYNKGNL